MDNLYRKKPVVIEAVQWDGNLSTAESFGIPECHQNLGSTSLEIPTLAGRMTVPLGNWLMKGVKGEFYPCEISIFEATYEKVEQEAQPIAEAPVEDN